ncbi:MAG: FAD-binding dehydrogenase [Nocardioides sp.]|nr:FAD-binding dehydrogenase [Nocardioides sp.]
MSSTSLITITTVTRIDVIVLGSGAAGLVAALAAARDGARVVLLEKGDLIGGTTAYSSGVVWLPVHPLRADLQGHDARAEALRYLGALSHGMTRPERVEAFVDGSPDLVRWLHERTQVRLRVVEGFPDYHPEEPGGRCGGGRSLEPDLFEMGRLGVHADRLVGTPRRMLVAETPTGGGSGILPPEVVAQRQQAGVEGLGRALVGALLASCLEAGVEVRPRTRATVLTRRNGRVTGVRLADGEALAAARGVVLATGGFEQDRDLVRAFLRGPMSDPPGVATNTGDGLRMAMRVGAALENMREAWWVPVTRLPEGDSYGGRGVHLVLRERTLPRSIMVNGQGRRFANEAANYNALGGAFHQLDPTSFGYANQPCWLLLDQGFVDRYGGFGAPPGGPLPSTVRNCSDLAGLARMIDVPSDALEETVDRWNRAVAAGRDGDFRRGESAYDGWCGDQTRYPGPGATLGPLDEPPFHAVPVVSSALGTSGGPTTGPDGEVLDVDGNVVEGLYAAGNVTAAPTGMVYGGAGGTLGPALVMGMLAGRAAAR